MGKTSPGASHNYSLKVPEALVQRKPWTDRCLSGRFCKDSVTAHTKREQNGGYGEQPLPMKVVQGPLLYSTQ